LKLRAACAPCERPACRKRWRGRDCTRSLRLIRNHARWRAPVFQTGDPPVSRRWWSACAGQCWTEWRI